MTVGLGCLNGNRAANGLKKGSQADITIFDPEEKFTVGANSFYSKGRNTPFDGWKLKGKVKYTIIGGRLAFDDEKGIFSSGGW